MFENKIPIVLGGGITIPIDYMNYISLSHYAYKSRDGDHIATFKVLENNGKRYIQLPRNMDKLLHRSMFRRDPDRLNIIDKRMSAPITGCKVKENFSLRNYQVEPVKQIINTLNTTFVNSCLLQAAPGSGKSYILPKIVEQLGQRTLILVDRNLLRDQMLEEFTGNSQGTVQVLANDTQSLCDVNITTFQMLMKNPHLMPLLREGIGFVIIDECHVAPAKEFSSIILQIPAKYRLGLSATPSRSDGLTEVIFDTFGTNIVYGDNPDSLKVFNIVVNTAIPLYWSGKHDYAEKFVEALFKPLPEDKSVSAMDLMIKTAVTLKNKGRRPLIYVTYDKLQQWTKTALESEGFTVGVISGKVSAGKRDKIIADFQSGKIDFLVSGVILQKGVSIHKLDTIINLSPQNKEGLEQTIGRLRREHKDKKEPMFIYFTFAGKMVMTNEDRVEIIRGLSHKGDKFARMGVKKFKEKMQ